MVPTEPTVFTERLVAEREHQLQPDGTVFPPVTPDPPCPPGYVSPVEESPLLQDPWHEAHSGRG